MSTKDLLIYGAADGGDMAVVNNDIALGDQLLQQALLALFGGNVEADTLGNELSTQIRNDWWGNALLFPTNTAKQFNSQTERALSNNALNSTGRINIQRAAEADLAYLSAIATVTVNVTVPAKNKCQISVNLVQPAGQLNVTLQILWDGAKNEMIINKII